MSSTPDERRVVVTGLGATTPLGGDVDSTWKAALAGESGARALPQEWLDRYDLPVHFACRLAVPTSEVLPKHEAKKLDPSGQYAMVAAREAWADAGSPEVDPERLGAVVATGIGGVWTLLDAYDTLKESGPRRVLPMTVPMLMPNGAAGAVAIEFGARAGAHSPVSACASGAEAMAYALDMIRTGRADVVIAGGTEAAIHPLPIAGFAAMRALSTRNDSPETASRPYDTSRDGFVLGEGAGIVVLESHAHATARGRQGLRRGGLGRSHLRRPPHRRARPCGPRRHPRDERGAVQRRHRPVRGRAHQRARHLDPCRRHRRVGRRSARCWASASARSRCRPPSR